MLALVALVASGWSAWAAPLEVYGKLPNIEQVELSPSGRQIAMIATDGDNRTIIVQTTADRKTERIAAAGSAKVLYLKWAGEDHLIVVTSTSKQAVDLIGPDVESELAFDLDLKAGRLELLLRDIRNSTDAMNTIYGPPVVRILKGEPVVFVHGVYFPDSTSRDCLFRVNLDTGVAQMVAGLGDDWVIDENGDIVAQAAYDERANHWSLKVKGGLGGWRTVEQVTAKIERPDLVGLSADGRSVIAAGGDEETGASWRELSLDTGAWGAPVVLPASTEPLIDDATSRVVGRYALVGDDDQYLFFDPHEAAVWRGITKAYAGDRVSYVSESADHKTFVVLVDSAELGPAYALVSLDNGQATWIGAKYVGLAATDVSVKRPIRYHAADGLEITGYLTLPHGREPKKLPLVVLVHGGPAGRDDPGFDWWSQAIASRGYAVLQVNFRGSDGFGWKFLAAGFGEFGRKMQTDLSDGVRYLSAQGIIDPKRVCIVGGSYGGYAALAGATLDPTAYRCAVSYAGMSDMVMDVRDSTSKGGKSTERYWLRFLGARDISDPVLKAISPAYHVDQLSMPLLLIHGSDDTVVVFKQSQRMADAMKQAGKPVELLKLPGEDHHLSRGATRLQMLQASVAFLEKNNPPN